MSYKHRKSKSIKKDKSTNYRKMEFNTTVKKGNCFLNYSERIITDAETFKIILDFDGYSLNIKSHDYLIIADDLHRLISDEFEKVIKQPIYDYMRNKK